jgi:hypothetical protein
VLIECLDIHAHTINLNVDFIPFAKLVFSYVTDLNIKYITTKHIEENIREKLGDFVFGNDFLIQH